MPSRCPEMPSRCRSSTAHQVCKRQNAGLCTHSVLTLNRLCTDSVQTLYSYCALLCSLLPIGRRPPRTNGSRRSYLATRCPRRQVFSRSRCHAPPHKHRTRTERAIYQPTPRDLSAQVALFGECVLSEDSTPSNCQKLEEALSELQQAIETCSVDAPEDCDTEEVATELKEDTAPEAAVAKSAAKSGVKRRAVKNLLHVLTLGLFKTKLSPFQAPTNL
eukprot:scaffold82642_cov30-Phaeocystis_antarctica.AAC.2